MDDLISNDVLQSAVCAVQRQGSGRIDVYRSIMEESASTEPSYCIARAGVVERLYLPSVIAATDVLRQRP